MGTKGDNLTTIGRDPEGPFLCAHCRVGIIYILPSKCPECDKVLNKKVIKEEYDEKENSS